MSGPSLATVKRLFAVSGNKCAFPRCNNPLVDPATGKVTGRICHIKARNPSGKRYDPDQSDDERHAFENLILMCPIHHDVIDSDSESYTTERLQEIKARHETENAGGYEPSDDIAYQLLANVESHAVVVLSAGDYGRIDWNGDVLHDSTKIVVDQAAVAKSQEADRAAGVESLVRDIQSALYGDNGRLPYVLTLCLDLCDRVGLSEKYEKWLKQELNGYRGYEEFPEQFDNEDQFEGWMREWASHRLIRPYIKGMNYTAEGKWHDILKLPIDQLLIAFPVAQIARAVDSARSSRRDEFSVPLLNLGQEHFAKLESVIAEVAPGSQVPLDLEVFYTVSDLEQVLDGVRNIVLSLLSDVRSRTI